MSEPMTVRRSDEEWRELLSPEEFRIARKGGTERAFTGRYHATKTPGTYRCVCCGIDLFTSEQKYDSGTGWPSFYAPAAADRIETRKDRSALGTRTEALCSRCGAHLGHLFPDGPAPTGLRYCINSASLELRPSHDDPATRHMEEPWKIYYDEFERRAQPILRRRFEREADLAGAAHEAYRSTSDRLGDDGGWGDDDNLVLTRGFNATVKSWIDAGRHDLDELRGRLEEQWRGWERSRGTG